MEMIKVIRPDFLLVDLRDSFRFRVKEMGKKEKSSENDQLIFRAFFNISSKRKHLK